MRTKSLVIPSLLLLWLITAAPLAADQTSSSATEATKPILWADSYSQDFGTIKAGSDAVATFVFHNDSDKPIKILKAKPS